MFLPPAQMEGVSKVAKGCQMLSWPIKYFQKTSSGPPKKRRCVFKIEFWVVWCTYQQNLIVLGRLISGARYSDWKPWCDDIASKYMIMTFHKDFSKCLFNHFCNFCFSLYLSFSQVPRPTWEHVSRGTRLPLLKEGSPCQNGWIFGKINIWQQHLKCNFCKQI